MVTSTTVKIYKFHGNRLTVKIMGFRGNGEDNDNSDD